MRKTLAAQVAVLMLAACGDDDKNSGGRDTTGGTDIAFPDVTVADSSTADSGEPTTSVVDTAVTETTVADTSVVDSSVADSATATTADSSVADSAAEDTSTPADTSATTTVADTSTTDTSGPTCITLPAGHARHVVVARPYAEPDGDEADRWEVLPILADGSLGKASDTFTMARASYGKVSFSADGALGVVATDDGTVNVIALSGDGKATVIADGIDPGVYADSVQLHGAEIWFINPNWPASGGGIYVASFACDGTIGAPHLAYNTKNASGLVLRADGTHLVAARNAIDETLGALHLVRSKGASWERVASANSFPEDLAILASLAVTNDGLFALVGENSAFSGLDNRVAAISLATNTITPVNVLTPIEDPYDIVVSPMNDAALVVTGFDDNVRVLDYDATRGTPFIDMGTPDYVTQKPQLPGDAVLVGGAFPNLVYVAENQAIRRFRFDGNGVVTDLGRTSTGATELYTLIPGALGVQP